MTDTGGIAMPTGAARMQAAGTGTADDKASAAMADAAMSFRRIANRPLFVCGHPRSETTLPAFFA
jgi:hypothetical protein